MFSLSESLRNTCVYSVGLRPSILINVCVALCLFIIRFSSFCPHRYRRVHSYRRLYCLYCRFAYRLSSGRSVLWSSSLSSILRSGSVALLLIEYSVVHVLSFVLILIRPCRRPLSVACHLSFGSISSFGSLSSFGSFSVSGSAALLIARGASVRCFCCSRHCLCPHSWNSSTFSMLFTLFDMSSLDSVSVLYRYPVIVLSHHCIILANGQLCPPSRLSRHRYQSLHLVSHD